MTSLYYIENEGCDDTTHGLARISDEDFPKFQSIIENLNKNSTYGCMPKIAVYRVEESDMREMDEDEEVGAFDDYIFHLDGKRYTFAQGDGWRVCTCDRERVI